SEILPDGMFPAPEGEQLEAFLTWDDWKVLGKLSEGQGGEHGERLRRRNHYRRIYETNEVCTEENLRELDSIREELGPLIVAEGSAAKSWYKTGKTDIAVLSESRDRRVAPLSH